MHKLNIGLFISGTGSTFKCINESIKNDILQINIDFVVINKDPDNCIEITQYCNHNHIQLIHFPFNFLNGNRDKYLSDLIERLKLYNTKLYFFLGWNMIVNDYFINNSPKILNLHPSLPNSFVGTNCIKKAYNAYQRGEVKYTGSMVHEVILEVDKGKVYDFINVEIKDIDTLYVLEQRVKKYEKELVVSVLQKEIFNHN
jgi:folate-dependent phosphoribosylglycinamide formyltransferase PurN